MSRFPKATGAISVLLSVTAHAQTISTFAGADFVFDGDGKPALQAPLGDARGVAADPYGNVYISDLPNNLVAKVTPDGILHVFARNGLSWFSGDGGPATRASLSAPYKLHFGTDGFLYIGDSGNLRVRQVAPAELFLQWQATDEAGSLETMAQLLMELSAQLVESLPTRTATSILPETDVFER